MYKNKQSVRISHFRSFLFVTVMWILGGITVKVNKNVFTWSKELPKKYTHRVNEKSMDIQGNEHTLFILLTTFFLHSPLSFCFSFFHVFSFLSISCIILKPSHIPFFSVSHLGHYCVILSCTCFCGSLNLAFSTLTFTNNRIAQETAFVLPSAPSTASTMLY